MYKQLSVHHATHMLFEQFGTMIEENRLCIQIGSSVEPEAIVTPRDNVFLMAVNGRVVLGGNGGVSFNELVFTLNGMRLAFEMDPENECGHGCGGGCCCDSEDDDYDYDET